MSIYLEKKEKCCGCKACQDICSFNAISFNCDDEGFWYPNIDENKCVECKLCEKICPQLIKIEEKKPLEIYAARNINEQIINQSSSGGIFTALATTIINEKKGHVYCVEYDNNMVAKYKCVDKIEDLNSCRGSKYVQADAKEIYKNILEDLKNGIFVMFIGTPCQAAAVREITKNNEEKILIVDFICHGVPSPKLFKEYIDYMQKKNRSKIVKYNNRSKIEGWKHLEELTFENGKVDYTSSFSQAWRNIFYSHNCLRPSCYECRYNHYEKRRADITIADYWGIDNFYKDFSNDAGNSLVVIYTKKGEEWFKKMSKQILYISSEIEYCIFRQPHFRGESAVSLNRDEFWVDYKRKGVDFIIKKYGKCTLKLRTKKFIKRKLGRI